MVCTQTPSRPVNLLLAKPGRGRSLSRADFDNYAKTTKKFSYFILTASRGLSSLNPDYGVAIVYFSTFPTFQKMIARLVKIA